MNKINTQKSLLNYRTALVLALTISLLMNLLFLIMFFYGRPPMMRENHPIEHIFRIQDTLVRIVSNFLVTFFIYLLSFKLLRNQWFVGKMGIAVYILLIAVGTVFVSVVGSFLHPFEHFIHNRVSMIFGGLMRNFTVAAVVSLSSLLLYIFEKQQKMTLENERLQSEYMKTRFLALKNQVDPHFLFNSLNTLSALIKTDAEKADDYVRQLSYIFRYTLQNKDVITLEEEMKFTTAYCRLMQIRYGDSLKFIYEVDEKYFPYSVIPISLQTLVENAIKHNVVSNRQPLVIAFATTDKAMIKVSNPIQPKQEAERGESIGLSNLAERYRLMWNKEITIRNTSGIFEVELPLIA